MANNLASFLRGLSIGANEEYDAIQNAKAKSDEEKARQVSQYELEVFRQAQENDRLDKRLNTEVEVAKIRSKEEATAKNKQLGMYYGWRSTTETDPTKKKYFEDMAKMYTFGLDAPEPIDKSPTVASVPTPDSSTTPTSTDIDAALEAAVPVKDGMQEGANAAGGVTKKIPSDVAAEITGDEVGLKPLPEVSMSAAQSVTTPLTSQLAAFAKLKSAQQTTGEVKTMAGDIAGGLSAAEEVAKTDVQAAEAAEKLGDKVYKDAAGQNPMDLFKSTVPTTEELIKSGNEMPLFYDSTLIGGSPPTTARHANRPEYSKQRTRISQTISMLSTAAMNQTKNLNTSADEIAQDSIRINTLMNSGKVVQTGKLQNGYDTVNITADPQKLEEIQIELQELMSKYGLDMSALTTIFPPKK